MRYELDERGSVIPESIRLSVTEVRRKGWLFCSLSKVPPLLRPAVMEHRRAFEESQRQAELDRRFGKNRNHPNRRRAGIWLQVEERLSASQPSPDAAPEP